MGVKIKLTDGTEKKLIEYGEVNEFIVEELLDHDIDSKVTTEVTNQIGALNLSDTIKNEVESQLSGITIEPATKEPKTYILATYEELKAITDMSVGDIAIIKALIIEDKYSYTGYIYSKIAEDTFDWLAMDGNYSANNIYFSENIMVTTPVGTITAETIAANNGSVSYEAVGKNIHEVFTGLFSEAKDPIVDKPSVSISVSGGSGEVGTTFDYPIATLKIDDVGSYTYGSKDANDLKYEAADTGVIFASGNVVLKNGDDNATTNETAMTTGNTITLQATTGETTYSDTAIEYTFTGTASYTESDRIPINNLGTKIPSKQITSDSVIVTSKTATFTGYRKCFWGYRKTVDALENPESITSEQVRNSTIIEKSGRYMIGTTNNRGNYTVPAETKQVYFLAPNGQFTSLSITNKSALGAPVACTYVESGIQVEGANKYEAKAYDLWYVNLDSEFSDSAELVLTWK
ncbi:MAG: hypothetical protein J6A25_00850 [Lachnospiraceae bacterium]|nr:hypothetical protein [Lachnospiraceae bacterium]